MINEKIQQAADILIEKNIDLWLTFVRESANNPDPCMDLIVGTNVTWQSAFIINKSGESVAIVGHLDDSHIRSVTPYQEVISYKADIREDLLSVLDRFSPKTIAINYSRSDVMADGLGHGLWQVLRQHLSGTPHENRLVSSGPVASAVRGRKSPAELHRIKEAIRLTQAILESVTGFIKPGKTEKEIAGFVKNQVTQMNHGYAWNPEMCPSVFSGPNAAGAHAGPTDRKIERGHLLNLDFGLKVDDYCADLQRTWYILREGEEKAPPEVEHGFATVRDAIQKANKALRPGATGLQIDQIARGYVMSQGYDEYPHGLGHQVGRIAHDGGAMLGPSWPRYGDLPNIPLELGEVYTIEPRVSVPGHGVATLEEMTLVQKTGGQFLSNPQKEIWLV